jgi:methylmalonyl-CoA/ethylmalonyl-CoA epimerase
MNAFGLTFHHLGLVVQRPEAAFPFLKGLDYTFGPEVYDPLQNVRLIMCGHESFPAVEIIAPKSAEDTGPVSELALKNRFGLVYHTCFETAGLEGTLAAWEKAGLRVLVVSEPKPAVLFSGRKVSFYMVSGMGLVELLE